MDIEQETVLLVMFFVMLFGILLGIHIGFAFGVPAIYGFNAIRIMVLIIVGKYFPWERSSLSSSRRS